MKQSPLKHICHLHTGLHTKCQMTMVPNNTATKSCWMAAVCQETAPILV